MLFDFLKKLVGHFVPRTTPRFSQEGDVSDRIICPKCGRTDELYEGPSGGAGQNIGCGHDGMWFNVAIVSGGYVLVDILGVRQDWLDRLNAYKAKQN